jgi:hypothetical protein
MIRGKQRWCVTVHFDSRDTEIIPRHDDDSRGSELFEELLGGEWKIVVRELEEHEHASVRNLKGVERFGGTKGGRDSDGIEGRVDRIAHHVSLAQVVSLDLEGGLESGETKADLLAMRMQAIISPLSHEATKD